MKRNGEPIRTVSYGMLTPDGSVSVCLEDMNADQRVYIATKNGLGMLNAQYAGQAEFRADLPSWETVFTPEEMAEWAKKSVLPPFSAR